MRALIPFLLLSSAMVGACDRQSVPAEQANAVDTAATGEIIDGEVAPDNATAPVPAAKLDRTHKGQAAPTIAFTGPDGKPVMLAAFRGKPVLVNLWATWCAPCIAEMPTLDRLAAREADRLEVIAISQDLEGAARVTPFFAKAGLTTLKPYLDPDLGMGTLFGANLPLTILYDSQGREVWRRAGEFDWAGDAAKALIAEAR